MSELTSAIQATILIVDDYPANLVTFNTLLPLHFPHCSILNAINGEEGMRMVESENPDIVLLDVSMPGMDGYEMCQRVKNNPKTAHIPVLLISAVFTEHQDRATGFSCGADGYVCKPYDRTELIAQIMALLCTKKQRDSIREAKTDAEEKLAVSNRELEFAEQLLGQIVNSLPVVLWALDLEGRVIMLAGKGVDQEKSSKFTRQGYSILKAYEDAVPHMQEKFDDAVKGHTNQSIEELGGNLWQVIYIPLKNADADTVGVVGMAVDITEQHRNSAALLNKCEHIQEAVGRNLAEDLGQQLTGLGFMVRALEAELKANPVQAAEEAAHIRSILDNVIARTRNLANGLTGNAIIYRLSAALDGLTRLIKAEHHAAIHCDVKDEVDNLDADLQGQLYTIVQEAIHHALHQDRASRIDIRLWVEGESIHLEIRHDGQSAPPKATASEGLGMLLISYRIQKMGGQVTLSHLPESELRLTAAFPMHLLPSQG